MAAGYRQRPVARQFPHGSRRTLPAVEIKLIADDQVIEVDHQQRIFLLLSAHAFKEILSAEFALFLTAGSHETNAILRWNIFHPLGQFEHHAQACRVVVHALQRQPAEVVIRIGIAHRSVGIKVRHDNNLFSRATFMRRDNRTAGHVMPVFRFIS